MQLIEQFLSSLKDKLEQTKVQTRHLGTGSSDNGFECLVSEVLNECGYLEIEPTSNTISATLNFGHHFPDITLYIGEGERIRKYGLELKSTQGKNWRITGGSFFESVTDSDYEEIYVLFGMINKKTEDHYTIKYRPYWQALSTIAVTHSPRYLIDMESDASIFSSLSDYQAVRNLDKGEKAKWIKQFLREHVSNSSELWYLPDQLAPEDFASLSAEKKKMLIAEAYILFPNDLLKPRSADYKQVAAYWVDRYYTMTTNIRDRFSASGKKYLHGILVPHTIYTLSECSGEIKEMLRSASLENKKFIREHWKDKDIKHFQSSDLLTEYYSVLNSIAKQYSYSELFKEIGLDFAEGVLGDPSL